ncbi:hypothetical protein AG4045_012364 [Apium graveolens]|uniref:Uncharacterized protein n=1 Tax=Apium graveolens TaxID=4045 RepID=A0A6L5BD66_APIGR|nr:hypothetical protein AG4045_012364 [Apium graveolens]
MGLRVYYFGKNIPINLVPAIVFEVVLLGGAEYYKITNGLVCSLLLMEHFWLFLKHFSYI